MRSVVVTGTSSGIGQATAKVLIDNGFRVFGSVRRTADAERLAAEFGACFVPLIFDVAAEAAVKAAAGEVRERLAGERLFGLVNNAGILISGPLLELPIADFARELETNLIGVLICAQAFAPLLGIEPGLSGKPGRIVNISSVGGRNAIPFTGPYHASKFALEGMSISLRRELLLFGIDVIVIDPGAVATPLWDKAAQLDMAPYEHTPYGPPLERLLAYMVPVGKHGLPPEQIGRTVLRALTAQKPKVRYTVSPQPLLNWIGMHMPPRLLDRMIARMLGFPPAPRQ